MGILEYTWLGELVQCSHMIATRVPEVHNVGQWLLGLHYFKGSCVLGWPCRMVKVDEPTLGRTMTTTWS